MVDPQEETARDFEKTADFLVGVDSDGCVFDTMEVKHKECFIPAFVEHFGLAAISKYAREVAEFVNLYSDRRGINRFPGYLAVLDLLAERPEVARRDCALPRLAGLRDWAARETKLGDPALEAELARTGDPDLALALEWSRAANAAIARIVRRVPPFPLVRECLDRLAGRADVMVVSATPVSALCREWEEHGLADHVASIAGQEMGSKKECLKRAAGGRYDPHRVLMIGDAPGDRIAATSQGYLFFPINPGAEDGSWKQLHDEALPRFFDGYYAGAYQDRLVAHFEALLPRTPPWKTGKRA